MRTRAFNPPRGLFLILFFASFTLSCRLATELAGRIRPDAPVPAGGSLIVYVGPDGNIYTIDRRGENRRALTRDANPSPAEGQDSLVYRYPTWALDGERLAFVKFSDLGGPRQSARVLVINLNTGTPADAIFSSSQYLPFYLFWSPDSQMLSFLSNAEGAGGLALHLAAVNGSGSQLAATGQPFYWDFSPLEQETIIHTGGSAAINPDARLAYLPLERPDAILALDLRPGSFQAPAWSPDGSQIALVGQRGGEDALLLLERESGEQHEIAASKGLSAFSWSPDGSSLAYTIPFSDGRQRVLYLYQPGQTEDRQLAAGFITAFFWSPDSSRLAFFEPTLNRPGEDVSFDLQQPAEVYMSLKVLEIESGMSRNLVNFDPSDAFLSLLPFFDQYQRSIRLWSPDSQELVVTALDEQGESGVYTVDTGTGSFTRIAPGDQAFWSWK